MAGEFRYPLTRYCLRSGTMTLPQAMVGLFPEGRSVTALDTKSGAEHLLTLEPPRTVTGLGELYRANRLAVNDELQVRALDDGRFAITPVTRQRVPDYSTEEGLAALLDELHEASARLSEQEIRAVHDVPEDVDLDTALRADGRFALHEGRWVNASTLVVEDEVHPPVVSIDLAGEVELEDDPVAAADPVAVGVPSPRHELNAPADEPARAAADAGRGEEQAAQAMFAGAESSAPQSAGFSPQSAAGQGLPQQAGLWAQELAGPDAPGAAGHDVQRTVVERRAVRTPFAVEEAEDYDEPASEVTELTSRFRRVMGPVGYRIEPVGKGQLRLVAAMGRRTYKVLAQLLTRSERLDWAELLSKRRGDDYRHLAVVGDHHDLLRLTGPAELARATLWSWQGLERMASLRRTVPLSPIDLEPHFERDGLFEHGLQRFEATIAERVAERGALSEVLSRLNQLRAPAVFLLEDLVADMNMSRDRALAILERLTAAPFHLVARVDHGEFVLRQSVASALSGLSSYALALKDQLPERQVEKLTGLGEPELLVGSGEWDDEGQDDEEPTSEGGISA